MQNGMMMAGRRKPNSKVPRPDTMGPARRLDVHPVFHNMKTPPHPALDYRPPRALRMLKLATTFIIALAVFSGLYVGWWFFLAANLRDAADTWVASRQGAGDTVSYSRLELTGFPFVLRLVVTAPSFKPTQDRPFSDWMWKGDNLVAESLPFPGSEITLTTSGAQTVSLRVGGVPRLFEGAVGRLSAQTASLTTWTEGVTLHADGVVLADRQGERLGVRKGKIVISDGGNAPKVSVQTDVDVEGLVLPKAWSLPLGTVLSRVAGRAQIKGDIPTDLPSLESALDVWRDDGGTVEVTQANIQYGPLNMDLTATLALDGDMQPVGAGTAQARGLFEAIDELRRGGLVAGKEALTAKIVLGALSRRSADGRERVMNVALSLQKQMLYAGPVGLIAIPKIEWSDRPTDEDAALVEKNKTNAPAPR